MGRTMRVDLLDDLGHDDRHARRRVLLQDLGQGAPVRVEHLELVETSVGLGPLGLDHLAGEVEEALQELDRVLGARHTRLAQLLQPLGQRPPDRMDRRPGQLPAQSLLDGVEDLVDGRRHRPGPRLVAEDRELPQSLERARVDGDGLGLGRLRPRPR